MDFNQTINPTTDTKIAGNGSDYLVENPREMDSQTKRNLNVATGRLRPSRSNLRFLRADAKYHVNKLQEKGEKPIEQEQIIASDRQEVAAKWSRFIF